jgi:aryl sulfotransferase
VPELLRAPTRRVVNPVCDSSRWDHFKPRDGDIIIGTYRKCGTTWTQRIVDLLVFQTPDARPVLEISPWLDSLIFNPLEEDLAMLEAQRHRRFIKSHLPLDALPIWDTVKYIHTGRDGRDSILSWQNHAEGMTAEFTSKIIANAMALAGGSGGRPPGPPPGPPPADPRAFLSHSLGELEAALANASADPTFFQFETTYWRERTSPNLLMVHYNDLKEDLPGEMRRIADFLEIDVPAAVLPELARAASFEAMKSDGDALMPKVALAFDRGADRFLNQGKSGRWREIAAPEDVARYESIARRAASPSLAAWLAGGRRSAGEPRSLPD